MAITPLKMPNLSALPDPTKDLMEGLGSPDSLMRFSSTQVNDLLSPKPINAPDIKLSSQAKAAIDAAQRQENAVLTQAAQEQENLQRQQAAFAEQQAKAVAAQTEASANRQKAYAKAQEQLKKATAKAQGGVVGAAADGTFVMDKAVAELTNSADWNAIVSNDQRNDLMEQWLEDNAKEMRSLGVSEDVIASELDVGRRLITAHTNAYTKRMKDDNIDPLDLGTSLAKAGNSLIQGVQILFGDTAGLKDTIQDAETIRQTYSDTMLLDQANYEYQRAKSKEANPNETLVEGFVQGAKDAWESDNVISSVVDTVGYIPYVVAGGGIASRGINLASKTLPAGRLASAIQGTAAPTTLAGRGAAHLLSADTLGASLASGTLAATDAASGAFSAVSNLNMDNEQDLDTLHSNYIANYGQGNWDALLARHGGDVSKAKDELALQAGRQAGTYAFAVGATTGLFGLEATLLGISSKGLAAQAGKRMLTVGFNTLSETLEEGSTQLSQNLAAAPYTGVSLTDDVGATAAMGAIAGGGMSVGTQAVSAGLDTINSNKSSNFKPDAVNAEGFVSEGNLDLASYKATVGTELETIATKALDAGFNIDEAQQLQQVVYNDFIDRQDNWQTMTPEQRNEFRDYLKLAFNVNTNGYATHVETTEIRAYNGNSLEAVKALNNPTLLDAYRVKNGLELDQVPPTALPYFTTLNTVLQGMNEKSADVTTRERELQMRELFNTHVLSNSDLNAQEREAVTAFMYNFADAGSRRRTDTQQKAWQDLEAVKASIQPQGATNDTQEQTEPRTAQPNQTDVGSQPATSPQARGTEQRQGDGTPTQVGEFTPANQGSGDAQSVGDADARQAAIPSDTGDTTPRSRQNAVEVVARPVAPSPTRVTSDTTAARGVSPTVTQYGADGQASASRQSVRQANSITAQEADGDGSPRTAETERDTNDGSQEAATQDLITEPTTLPAIAPNITTTDAAQAYKALGTKQRADIRRLVVDKQAPIDALYGVLTGTTADLTNRLNALNTTKTVASRITNAIMAARDYLMSAERVIERVQLAQRRNTANQNLVPAIESDMGLKSSEINNLGGVARDIYGYDKLNNANKPTMVAKLLADFAGVPDNLILTLLAGKLEGSKRKARPTTANKIASVLSSLRDNGIVPMGVEVRPPPVTGVVNYEAILSVVDTVEDTIYKQLQKFTKRMSGSTSQTHIVGVLQALIQAQRDGVSIDRYVEARAGNLDVAADVLAIIDRAEAFLQSDQYALVQEAERWIRIADPEDYRQYVTSVVVDMVRTPNSLLNKVKNSVFNATKAVTGVNVITLTRGKTNSRSIDLALVSQFLSQSIADMSQLGERYINAILQARGGVNENGILKVSKTAANNVERLATRIRSELTRRYIEGKLDAVQLTEEQINENTIKSKNAGRQIVSRSKQFTEETSQDEDRQSSRAEIRDGDVQQRDIFRESGQGVSQRAEEVSEQGQETRPLDRQRVETAQALLPDLAVSDTIIKEAFAKRANLTTDEKAALRDGSAKETLVSIRKKLTSPQEWLSAVELSGLNKLADYLGDDIKVSRVRGKLRSKQEDVAPTAPIQRTVTDVITNEEVTTIDEFLYDNDNTSMSSEEFVEQVIASRAVQDDTTNDPLIKKAENTSKIKSIIDRIWHALRSTVAAVSLAVAIATGVNISVPTSVQAATDLTPIAGEVVMTNKAKASLDHILNTNDNAGKPFVIADKKAGMLYLHTADGQVVNTTPALFGKSTSDIRDTSGVTPAGRYNLDYNQSTNLPSEYQGSVQSFDVGSDGSLFAIHRVLDVNGQGRPSRLVSKTGKDNRITYGCINVPSAFFDQHLDGQLDAVLYVLPETDNFVGTLYDVPQPSVKVTNKLDDITTTAVEVSPQQVLEATSADAVTTASTKALAPITIAGTQASGQVAYVQPMVFDTVSVDSVVTPVGVYTDAEKRADASFDTAPVTATYEGVSLAEIAVLLASVLGGGAVVNNTRRRRKLSSKSKPEDGLNTLVEDNHNAPANENKRTNDTTHVLTNLTTPPTRASSDVAKDAANWLEFIDNSHLTMPADGRKLDDFGTRMLNFEWMLNSILTDKSYEQATDGTFDDRRQWRSDITDPDRAGVIAKFMTFAAGATTVFDNLMKANNIASFGHEADSSIPTKMLAQVSAKTNGAYSFIYKNFVKPMAVKLDVLARDLKRPIDEIEADVGRLATVLHIKNEAASALFRSIEREIAEREAQLNNVNEVIASTPANVNVRQTLTTKADLLTTELRELKAKRTATLDTYFGKIPWDKDNVKLAGGYTEAEINTVIGELQTKYGSQFSAIEAARQDLVRSIRGVRQFATASGVFSNSDLELFNEIGFTEYVPLFSEQKDPTFIDESENATQQSVLDRLVEGLPTSQAKSMGLTKDLSRYRREGATTPAANAYVNLKVFSMNISGRVGQQGWLDAVQQLYEGTVGKPISATTIIDEEALAELNDTPTSGKLPGLIRVRPGMEQYLPRELRDKIGVNTPSAIRPIRAKGHDRAGEIITFNYYFTDKAVQNEVYSNTNINVTLHNKALRNVATFTRLAARMMTTFKPVWNVYNFARDIPERVWTMMFRPVKDQAGNMVSRKTMLIAYGKNIARLSSSLTAQNEIYRYIATGEVNTQLQRVLHEAVQEGAINLMTSQTDKHNIMTELSKSEVDKLADMAIKGLGTTIDKLGLNTAKRGSHRAVDYYVQRLTEVPQVTVALSAYMTYKDVGVNRQETANRVRDQYDPTRTSSEWIKSGSALYPFLRSTLSGHYNVARTLTQYWTPTEWQWAASYLAAGVAGFFTILAMMAGMMGDDDAGVPMIARLPTSDLVRGIPVPDGNGGVWTAPVGFGVPKIMWATAANLYKLVNGEQDGVDMTLSMLGVAMENTSPINVASGGAFEENPVAATVMTATPLLALPLMETAFGVRSFGGSSIYGMPTPRGQLDSDQDNFNTPEVYKRWAKSLYDAIGADIRPETLKHVTESYAYGPLKAIPKSLLADKADKTLGTYSTKGEDAGAIITAIGADIGWSPSALKDETHTWRMFDTYYKLLRMNRVPEQHSASDYEKYNVPRGVAGAAANLTRVKLETQGVDAETIAFIMNTKLYKDAIKKPKKDFRDAAMKYYNLRAVGEEDIKLRAKVEQLGQTLQDLTHDYVRDNNGAYLKLSNP